MSKNSANWRLAKSLTVLRTQLNTQYPNRSKVSDGSIGDANHASRKSDHNAWIRDGDYGIVTAIDLTHEPINGIPCGRLLALLLHHQDLRIKYIIFSKFIYSRSSNFVAVPYHGLNAHQHHLHISVRAEKGFYDDDSLWEL